MPVAMQPRFTNPSMALVASAIGPDEKAQLISSIYLVLPEMPAEQPEWIEALDRVSIAPKEEDITFLLNVLENANVANLIRVAERGQGVPVVVRPNDPAALPISPQYLRRALKEIREQWYADIGTANGRLEQGTFDVPPIDYVLDIFGVDLEEVGIFQVDQGFSAHET